MNRKPYVIYARRRGWILIRYSPGGRECQDELGCYDYRDETEAVRKAAVFLECTEAEVTVMAS